MASKLLLLVFYQFVIHLYCLVAYIMHLGSAEARMNLVMNSFVIKFGCKMTDET